jgi:hypothetical protein
LCLLCQGYIYIEAYKENAVKEATSGLRLIRNSKAPHMVPLKEVPESITVNIDAKAPIGRWACQQVGWQPVDSLGGWRAFRCTGVCVFFHVVLSSVEGGINSKRGGDQRIMSPRIISTMLNACK